MRSALFATLVILASAPVAAQDIKFGNNSSDYARDGECDDRRFIGVGMAQDLDWDDTGRDAADCRTAFNNGTIQLWSQAKAQELTQCSKISFGNDNGNYPNDGECDDPRFEGPGMDSIILFEDAGRDATDCRKMCDLGMIFVRDYSTN